MTSLQRKSRLRFPYGNASHSTFVVSRSTWLRCGGSPRPHMPEEICVSQSIIKTLPNSPASCQTNAHTHSSDPRYFWQYFILQFFFSFIKNSILMYLLTPKKLSKIDLLIIDELSYISFNKYQSKLIQLFENEIILEFLIDIVTCRSFVLNMNRSSSYLIDSTLNHDQWLSFLLTKASIIQIYLQAN